MVQINLKLLDLGEYFLESDIAPPGLEKRTNYQEMRNFLNRPGIMTKRKAMTGLERQDFKFFQNIKVEEIENMVGAVV